MKFTPIKRLPKFELVDDETGNPRSKPVLGLSENGGQGVVYAVKSEHENVVWITQCVNQFDVTEYLTGWQYLPAPNLKK